MKKIFILSFFISAFSAFGQEFKDIEFDTTNYVDTIPRIELITKYESGKMYLRWAPNNPMTWFNTLPFGYEVERYVMDTIKGIPVLDSKTSITIKPWEKEKFRPYNDKPEDNKFMLTMGECVHGEVSQTTKGAGFTEPSQEIENKYGFALFAADLDFSSAEAGGLGYTDQTGIIEGNTYFYVVKSGFQDSTIMPGLSTVVAQTIENPTPFIAAAIEGEGKVTLQWLRDVHEPFFSAYHIEKSIDGNNYTRINENPFAGGVSKEFPSHVFSFTDFVDNYKPAYYRIIGVTPFSKLSKPSAEVKLMGRDRTPCQEVENLSIVTDEQTRSVVIKWDPVECNDLKGYQIMKGSAPEAQFTQVGGIINPVLETEYRETVGSTRNKIYYKVMTLDTAGNRSFTLPRLAAFRDTMPPAIPTGLSGKVDTNGVVTIKWNGNTEDDFRGYHIYRANAEYHMFTLINSKPNPKPFFTDTITLKTMTEEIFYKVTSVDYQGHLSKFSEPLRLTRPDTIRPFPPSIIDYNQEEDHVYFNWTPSRSKDVVDHILYKKVNDGNWSIASDFDKSSELYTDYNVTPNNLYFYKIIAKDDADLVSVDHATVRIKFVDQTLPEIIEINSCIFLDSTSVKLDWTPQNDVKSKNITVYRSINGGPMTVVSRITENNSYVDRIRPKRKYSYAIKHVWKDGKKSKFSSTVTPKIQ